MKQVILAFLLPAVIALSLVYFLFGNNSLNHYLFDTPLSSVNTTKTPCVFIPNFQDNQDCEGQFLRSDSIPTLFLLGSSELTGATAATPYNFIPEHFTTKLRAVGHAGNQCFSIYSQLLAHQHLLFKKPIIIVLSPMWFVTDGAVGTSSKIFLEFNSDLFLSNIIGNNSLSEFKDYETEKIFAMYDDFIQPSFALKQFYFRHLANKSPLHSLVYLPVVAADRLVVNLKLMALGKVRRRSDSEYSQKAIIQDNIKVNWDSLYISSKKEMLDNSTNNHWGIGNDYFSTYIQGKTKAISLVPDDKNRELKDFRKLLKLLRSENVNASFLIIPMNPYYYVNLNEATPLINTIEKEIQTANFPCLNYWVADSNKYEKGILRDIMHLSSYGWYKADKFIVDTYHLAK